MKTEELNQNHVSLLWKAKTGGASAEPNKFVSAFGLHYLCFGKRRRAAPQQNQISLFLHSACTIFALESEDGRRLSRTKQVCFCIRLAPSLPQIRMNDVR